MRMRWQSADGYVYQIDTDNPELAAMWFKELMMKYADTFQNVAWPQPRIEIYPSGDYNARVWEWQRTMGVKELEWILDGFEKIAKGETP